MYDATFADLYDLIHAELREDIALVRRIARRSGGPLLELGCGSGRLLLPVAADGIAVTGVDNAPAMLTRAQAAAVTAGVAERVTLVAADMTQLALAQRDYGCIVIGTNTIMHVTAGLLRPVLRAAHSHARVGALLLIDTANPLLLAAADESGDWALERILAAPNHAGPIAQYSRFTHDAHAQTVTVDWRFERPQAPPYLAATTYHYHFPHALIEALQTCGWQPEQLSGEYDESPYEEESERLIIVARAV